MAKITDEQEIREIVLEAFRNPVTQIVVMRGVNYASALRAQLRINNVQEGDVCRAVNKLVEDKVLHREDTHVDARGLGPEPVKCPAVYLVLAR